MNRTHRSEEMRHRETSCGAFTRVDLLGVATGIVLLLATILPALGSAREKSLRLGCVDRLKDIGAAFRLFARDFNDRLPMGVSTNEGGSAEYVILSPATPAIHLWAHFRALSNHLSSPQSITCPKDTTRQPVATVAQLERPEIRNAGISYGVGESVIGDLPGMLLSADRSLSGGAPGFVFDGRAVHGNLGSSAEALASLGWASNGLHRQAGNGVVADGSVRQMSSPALRLLLRNSGDPFNAFSQPGRMSNE